MKSFGVFLAQDRKFRRAKTARVTFAVVFSAVKKNQNQAKKSESVEPANQNPLVRPIQNPIFAPESSYS